MKIERWRIFVIAGRGDQERKDGEKNLNTWFGEVLLPEIPRHERRGRMVIRFKRSAEGLIRVPGDRLQNPARADETGNCIYADEQCRNGYSTDLCHSGSFTIRN